jgi:hypothetical protein
VVVVRQHVVRRPRLHARGQRHIADRKPSILIVELVVRERFV